MCRCVLACVYTCACVCACIHKINSFYHIILDLISVSICNVIFNSYTMGTSGLPDIYTQSQRATGPRAEGVYIRRTTSAYGITIM